MRGEIPWDDDPVINNNVVVCSFLHHTAESMSTYKLISTGHRLHCSDNAFQLYREISQKTGRDAGRKKNNDRVFSRNNPVKRTVQNSDGKVEEERAEERFGDTFVKIGKGTGADVVVSVALGKISDRVRLVSVVLTLVLTSIEDWYSNVDRFERCRLQLSNCMWFQIGIEWPTSCLISTLSSKPFQYSLIHTRTDMVLVVCKLS